MSGGLADPGRLVLPRAAGTTVAVVDTRSGRILDLVVLPSHPLSAARPVLRWAARPRARLAGRPAEVTGILAARCLTALAVVARRLGRPADPTRGLFQVLGDRHQRHPSAAEQGEAPPPAPSSPRPNGRTRRAAPPAIALH